MKTKCPRCKKDMTRIVRTSEHKIRENQKNVFSEWDKCECGHMQHYERFKMSVEAWKIKVQVLEKESYPSTMIYKDGPHWRHFIVCSACPPIYFAHSGSSHSGSPNNATIPLFQGKQEAINSGWKQLGNGRTSWICPDCIKKRREDVER